MLHQWLRPCTTMTASRSVGPDDFDIQRYIGRGCYSIVYAVVKTTDFDKGSTYALKRFFLENDSSVKCVLRERRTLERIAMEEFQSPFLPILYYSIWHNLSSAFVLRKGSGCDLYDLLKCVGFLSEADARFYISEIICGLEHLHSLNIVHLDVKPENVLIYSDGHVFVSDLDRSYDLSANKKPTLDDFTGTPLFMAPEIASGQVIDLRADVWSLAVLAAELVTGTIRTNAQNTAEEFRRARIGSYVIHGFKRLSKPLQSFFTACLKKKYTERPFLNGVKELRFLKNVDWNKVNMCLLRPPYPVSQINHRASTEQNRVIVSTDVRLLSNAFSPIKPLTFDSSKKKEVVKTQEAKHATEYQTSPNILKLIPESLKEYGYNVEQLNELFASFNFIHPKLKKSFDLVENPLEIVRNLDSEIFVDNKFDDLDKVLFDSSNKTSSPTTNHPRRRNVSSGD